MSRKKPDTSLQRRAFLAGALGTSAVAAAALAGEAKAQNAPATSPEPAPKAAQPSAAATARETRIPPELPPLTTQRTGSDFMVEVIKTLKIDYMTCLPGSTFRALHESVINNGPNPNQMPEFITCLHEESSIAMAQGYAKRQASRCW